MKFIKKCLLFVFAIFISVSLTGCFNFGGGTGGNPGTPSNPTNPTNPSYDPNFDPSNTASQPQVKAIAGIYLPEEKDVSQTNIDARNKVYAGIKLKILKIYPEISAPTTGQTETVDEQLKRITNNTKRELIESSVPNFLTSQSVRQNKIGLFESEINDLTKNFNSLSKNVTYTEVGTNESKTLLVTFDQTEITKIKDKLVEYLQLPENVPGGTIVEGETLNTLVAPMVEIVTYTVEFYEYEPVLDNPIGVDMKLKSYYLDDGNGYSTRDIGGNTDNKMILPPKKWLSIYFEVQAGQEGYFWLLGADSYLTIKGTEESNPLDIIQQKLALAEYKYTLTANSSFNKIDYTTSKYNGKVKLFSGLNVDDVEEANKKDNPDYEMSDEEREQMEEEFEKLNSKYSGQYQFEINCYNKESTEEDKAPKFTTTSVDVVKMNGAYRSQYKYKKTGIEKYPYSIVNSGVNLDNTIGIHFDAGSLGNVAFGIEQIDITPSPKQDFSNPY